MLNERDYLSLFGPGGFLLPLLVVALIFSTALPQAVKIPRLLYRWVTLPVSNRTQSLLLTNFPFSFF